MKEGRSLFKRIGYIIAWILVVLVAGYLIFTWNKLL